MTKINQFPRQSGIGNNCSKQQYVCSGQGNVKKKEEEGEEEKEKKKKIKDTD
jgi:hypothetical protein